MTTLVELRGVHKHHRNGAGVVTALSGVDLTLKAGEVVALLGPSGSGKSSVLQLLCRWEVPDEGTIRWATTLVPANRWDRLAIVPQGLGLLDELTIRQNIELPGRLGSIVHDVDGLLDRLGLVHLDDRYPKEVSLGEQQRVAVARAATVRPSLLLADEPTSNQDGAMANQVLVEIRRCASAGAACLIATHSREAANYADRVVALRYGQIVAPT